MDVCWQILDTLSIPKTNIVITRHEYLMQIWQLNEPVQKVKHLFLCTMMTDVTAMNDDISCW